MKDLPLHEYSKPIAPGTEANIDVIGGNFFYIIRATHKKFKLSCNEGSWLTGSFARGHKYPAGELIEKIRVRNEDPIKPLDITVIVGQGDPIDHLFNAYENEVIPQPTRLFAQPAPSVPANGKVDLAGVYLPTDIRRKSIQVSNTSTTLWLDLHDTAGNPALRIRPLDNITLDIAGPLSIRNPNGAVVEAFISEIIFCEKSDE